MFDIGDCVSYPMHGAGTVEAIEERVILGEERKYFRIRFFTDGVMVMVPTEGSTGMRSVMDTSEVQRILCELGKAPERCNENWNRRYRLNLSRIRTGEAAAVADVIHSLTQRDRERGLSTGERRMLASARQIFCSELMVALGVTLEEAHERLDEAMSGPDDGGQGDGPQLMRMAR